MCIMYGMTFSTVTVTEKKKVLFESIFCFNIVGRFLASGSAIMCHAHPSCTGEF